MGKKLRRKLAETIDEISKILDKLVEESASGIPIVVEGKRDEEVLRSVGVKGEVIVFRSLRELGEALEKMEAKRVILLLDLDSAGERMTVEAKKFLEGVVGNVDTSYWKMLKRFKWVGLTEVEALRRIVER